MRPKDSTVNLDLSPETVAGLLVAARIYTLYGLNGVITSARDGKHGPNSLHAYGRAFDLRLPSRCLGYPWRGVVETIDHAIYGALKATLGKDWDVILETHQESPYRWHIHCEHQPED